MTQPSVLSSWLCCGHHANPEKGSLVGENTTFPSPQGSSTSSGTSAFSLLGFKTDFEKEPVFTLEFPASIKLTRRKPEK